MWKMFQGQSRLADEELQEIHKELSDIRNEVRESADKIAQAATRFSAIVDLHAREMEKATVLRSEIDHARNGADARVS